MQPHTVEPQFPFELKKVLDGLSLNRTPGFTFPGNFLDVSFDRLDNASSEISIEPGAHFAEEDGQVSFGALSVLADLALATSMRRQVGLDTRMATVSMAVQLNGALRAGLLIARSTFDGFVNSNPERPGLARSELFADGRPIGTASGIFVALGNKTGMSKLPLRRRGERPPAPPLAVAELTEAERQVFDRAVGAVTDATGAVDSFIRRFWGFLPVRVAGGARCEMPNGLHVGNRVGHTQGGLTFALAAITADSALGDEWQLMNISASYVSPGIGPVITAMSTIVHQGRSTAVVSTRLVGQSQRTVLETISNHTRRDDSP